MRFLGNDACHRLLSIRHLSGVEAADPILQHPQLVGNPNALPTLKAAPHFAGIGVVGSNVYVPGGSGVQWYISQSNFYRQIRNFITDISACPNTTPDGFGASPIRGIDKASNAPESSYRYPLALRTATSLQNIRFVMSRAEGTTHIGVFMENGSGGFLGDLTFVGGAIGTRCGSQQFTPRNPNSQYCTQAIEMI